MCEFCVIKTYSQFYEIFKDWDFLADEISSILACLNKIPEFQNLEAKERYCDHTECNIYKFSEKGNLKCVGSEYSNSEWIKIHA